MAYTKEQLKVYMSLTDEQLHTLGHSNLVKHREVAQAWMEGKEIQYRRGPSASKWEDGIPSPCVSLECHEYRIKPEPTVNVNINGREMSYYPPDIRSGGPARPRLGFIVIRDCSSGVYAVVSSGWSGWMWSTKEKAQQYADVLNALLTATPDTEK